MEIEHVSPGCICQGKYCRKCDRTRCVQHFGRHAGHSDNLQSNCKTCKGKVDQAYGKLHAKEKTARAIAHQQAHKAERKIYMQHYYTNNRSVLLARAQSEEYQANLKRRKAEHPERFRNYALIHTSRRRARKRSAGGKYSKQEWEALKAQYNYTCLRCYRQEPAIKLSPDHVIPLSRGGTNDIGNIQPLCRTCNEKKYATTIDYRLSWQERNMKDA